MNVQNIEQYVGKVAILYAKSREKKIRKLEQEVALLKELKKDYEKQIKRCDECGEDGVDVTGTCEVCFRYTKCDKCPPWWCDTCKAEICGDCENQCIGNGEQCSASVCDRCAVDNFCIGCTEADRGCKKHPLQTYEILPGRFLPACAICMESWKADSLEKLLEKFEEKNNQMKQKFM